MPRELIKEWNFGSIEERDKFFEENFRSRVCNPNVPGNFYLPGGQVITVFMEEAQLWSSRCEGIQDDDGAACDGEDVQSIKGIEPWDGVEFTASWCRSCRDDALMQGYKIEEIK